MEEPLWAEKELEFSSASEDDSPKLRKEKKQKKDKKHKKHKKKKDKDRSPSSEPSTSSKETSLQPKTTTSSITSSVISSFSSFPVDVLQQKDGPKRDDWMNSEPNADDGVSSFLFPTFGRSDLTDKRSDKKAAIKLAQQEETERIYRSRELNPELRSEFQKELAPIKGPTLPPEMLKEAPAPVAKPMGDGGASWLRSAYRRLQQQCADTGRSMEDLAAERYGSLAELRAKIEAAEELEEDLGKERDRRGEDSRRNRSDYSRDRNNRQNDGRNYDSGHNRRERSPRRDRDSRGDDYRSHRKSSPSRCREAEGDKDPFGRDIPRKSEQTKEESTRTFDKPVSARFVKPGEKLSDAWKARDAIKAQRSAAAKQPSNQTSSKEESRSQTSATQSSSESNPPVEQIVLTDAELNQINARILRAELMGDTDTVNALTAKIANATRAPPGTEPATAKRPREEVLLTRTHASGFSYPVKGEPGAPTSSKRPKVPTHNKAGERERYFADDDKYSLADLTRMERFQSAEDQNAMFARLAGKVTEKTDSDYGVDDAFMKKALSKEGFDQMSLKERDKAIMEHRQMASALSSCHYCPDGDKFPKHLVVDVGKKAFLMLVPYAPLDEGNCLICPIQHTQSGTMLDEDIWEEIQSYRRRLVKLFEADEMDCVFFETAMNLKSHPHMRLECVPMDRVIGEGLPMYYKKAIMEAEGEWTNNVKLIDLSKKDIRRAVPKTLPYFAVDFGLQCGYAHVIEDERKFPSYFGREVVGGMIDAEPRLWLRNIPQNFNEQIQRVNEFTKKWNAVKDT